MKNFIQEGCQITATAPYDVVAGAGAQVGAVFGVAVDDALSGADVVLVREGVFDLLAVTLDTFSQGDRVYWDNSAKKATSTISGNQPIGVALAAKVNTATTVRVLLIAGLDSRRVVAGETALDGSNPTPVTTGLTSITAVALSLKTSSAPGVGTSVVTYDTSGGTLNLYGWKPTSNANPTLIASTGTETVGWIAFGS